MFFGHEDFFFCKVSVQVSCVCFHRLVCLCLIGLQKFEICKKSFSAPRSWWYSLFLVLKGVSCHKAKASCMEVCFWSLFWSTSSLSTTLHHRRPTEAAEIPGWAWVLPGQLNWGYGSYLLQSSEGREAMAHSVRPFMKPRRKLWLSKS